MMAKGLTHVLWALLLPVMVSLAHAAEMKAATTTPSDVPVSVGAPVIQFVGLNVQSLTFQLTNTSPKPIVAMSVRVTLFDAGGGVTPINIAYDHFLGRSDLLPGETRDQTMSLKVRLKAALSRAEVGAVFAELEGGQAFGPDRAAIAPALEARWRKELQAYAAVQEALATPGPDASMRVQEILHGYGEKNTCSDAVAILNDTLKTSGIAAVKQKVDHPRPLW